MLASIIAAPYHNASAAMSFSGCLSYVNNYPCGPGTLMRTSFVPSVFLSSIVALNLPIRMSGSFIILRRNTRRYEVCSFHNTPNNDRLIVRSSPSQCSAIGNILPQNILAKIAIFPPRSFSLQTSHNRAHNYPVQ